MQDVLGTIKWEDFCCIENRNRTTNIRTQPEKDRLSPRVRRVTGTDDSFLKRQHCDAEANSP